MKLGFNLVSKILYEKNTYWDKKNELDLHTNCKKKNHARSWCTSDTCFKVCKQPGHTLDIKTCPHYEPQKHLINSLLWRRRRAVQFFFQVSCISVALNTNLLNTLFSTQKRYDAGILNPQTYLKTQLTRSPLIGKKSKQKNNGSQN